MSFEVGKETLALELMAIPSFKRLSAPGSTEKSGGTDENSLSPIHPCWFVIIICNGGQRRGPTLTTVILFSVRVPVLSEQIVVAPPIVSQAANLEDCASIPDSRSLLKQVPSHKTVILHHLLHRVRQRQGHSQRKTYHKQVSDSAAKMRSNCSHLLAQLPRRW